MRYLQRYEDQRLQNAYENACDCRYFGMGILDWVDCGVSKEQRKEIWAVSWYDMGDGYEETPMRAISDVMYLMETVYWAE